MSSVLQVREVQMWCPAPLPEVEIQRRKLRSDKYKPPAGRLLENYESDSSVEADEDTDTEAGADPAIGAAKSRRRTGSTVAKKSASANATAIFALKAAEQKKKRKNREASPPAVAAPMIPTPRSREVGSEDEEGEKEQEKEKEKEKRRMRSSKSCRSLKTRQRRGPRVLLPSGSGSWCRRRWRRTSDVAWRRSEVLRRRGRRYLRLLSPGCFGRRLSFRLRRGMGLGADAIFALFI
jgi:hypothetical protein